MNRKEVKYLILIILIYIAACVETDIYLPAFPSMMNYFNVSEEIIQSLLTWNFVGICISGPLYGPMSDSFGRKVPLFIALSLFLVGSMITSFTGDFKIMLGGRILQGLGSGGCFTLGTAVIFDVFREKKAIMALNALNTIIPLLMAGAPLVGGYLTNVIGFRSNFIAIAILVLFSFVICIILFRETLSVEKRVPFSINRLKNDFKKVFLSVPFWELTLIMSLLFGGYLVFVSNSSVLFVLEMGVPKKVFPLYQAAILLSYVIASISSSKAISKFGAQNIKRAGILLIILGSLSFMGVSFIYPANPLIINITMMFFAFGCSWIFGPYFGECMELMPEIKGITASLITSTRLLITSLIIGVCGKFYNGTIFPVVITIMSILILSIPMIIHYEITKKK